MASAGNHRYAKALVFEETSDYNSGESNTLVCQNGLLYFNGKQLSSPQGNQFDIFTANKVTALSEANITVYSNLVINPLSGGQVPTDGQGFQSYNGFLYYNGIQISAFSNVYSDEDQLLSNSIVPLGDSKFTVKSNLEVTNVMTALSNTITFFPDTLHFANAAPKITFNSSSFDIQPESIGTNVQFLGAKNGNGSDCNVNFVSSNSANDFGTDVVNLKFKNKVGTSPSVNHTLASIKVTQTTPFNISQGGGSMTLTARDPKNGLLAADDQLTMIHMNTNSTANTIVIAPDFDAKVGIGAGYTPQHRFQVGSNLYVDDSNKILGLASGYKISLPSNIWIQSTGGVGVTIGSQTQAGEKSVVIGTQAGNAANVVSIGFGHTGTPEANIVKIGSSSSATKDGSISIGNRAIAGEDGVAIGSNSHCNAFSVSVGIETGASKQGKGCIAIGNEAGQIDQARDNPTVGEGAIAIGYRAGNSNQGVRSVAVGNDAGRCQQGSQAVAIGFKAGNETQQIRATAIGHNAGYSTQGISAVAVGAEAGSNLQQSNAIAIGYRAGQYTQNTESVAIGLEAGYQGQYANSIAIGYQSGKFSQKTRTVAIGDLAGNNTQDHDSVAIGASAGRSNQASSAVAIGSNAGASTQLSVTVAIGYQAGEITQDTGSVAVGAIAGRISQGSQAVAIGYGAAANNQEGRAIAIGHGAGGTSQGCSSVAVGHSAGQYTQNTDSIAIGYQAGQSQSGVNSIYIGKQAGQSGTHYSNAIVLNASGSSLNPTQADAFYVKPVSYSTSQTTNVMSYNTSTGEIINSGAITILPGGKVGIGKTTPNQRLEVAGTVVIGGFDLYLGVDNQVSRGDSGQSRALVKDYGSTLVVNYDNDFKGGIRLTGNTEVTGRMDIFQDYTIGTSNTTHLNPQLRIGNDTITGGSAYFGYSGRGNSDIINAATYWASTGGYYGTNGYFGIAVNNLSSSVQDGYGITEGEVVSQTHLAITDAGNVGIGTTSPSYKLEVNGSLSKGSGSFSIDHPLPSMKETHKLRHSFVEAPRFDNIYRDTARLENGVKTINLDTHFRMTEGTFEALNRDPSVFTSNEETWDAVRGKVNGNILTIECQNPTSTAMVSFMVVGERHDEHVKGDKCPLSDENGIFIPEVKKPSQQSP